MAQNQRIMFEKNIYIYITVFFSRTLQSISVPLDPILFDSMCNPVNAYIQVKKKVKKMKLKNKD